MDVFVSIVGTHFIENFIIFSINLVFHPHTKSPNHIFGRRHNFVEEVLLFVIIPIVCGVVIDIVVRVDRFGDDVFDFLNHFVATTTSLGVAVVRRDANDIGGVDLHKHDTNVTVACVARQIRIRTEVKTRGTSIVRVVIYVLSFHLNNLPNGIVESSRVNILIVTTNLLIGEDVTILRESEATTILRGFDERPQLIADAIGRILSHLLNELNKRVNAKTFIVVTAYLFGERPRNTFAINQNGIISNHHTLRLHIFAIILHLLIREGSENFLIGATVLHHLYDGLRF